jgi:predicted AAA+ superfamily ATPase
VEINVLPLSFREYASGRGLTDDNAKRLFSDYISYGGLPGSLEFANGSSAQREYIESVFKTIIENTLIPIFSG